MVENSSEERLKPEKQLVVSDLETLRVLADPLHMQILDLLDEPKTVKQIAKATKLATTKLYYHIKQLEEQGLIQVVSTRVVSGIIEKQYQLKALNIKIDQRLLNLPGGSRPELELELVTPTFKRVTADIAASREAGLIGRENDAKDAPHLLLIRGSSRLTTEQAKKFYKRVEELFEEFGKTEAENSECQAYSFMTVLFPIVDNNHSEPE
jgi:DNA-binding transcriptional ArsR family regulator